MKRQDEENVDMMQENETIDVNNSAKENGRRFKKKKDKEKNPFIDAEKWYYNG